jgi:cytochrome c-type biogenesis protein CcmH
MRSTLLLAALVLTPCLGGCEESGPAVTGTITMSPALQQTLGASDTLFIVAKQMQPGVPPLAVLRIVGMKFPLTYKMTQEDVLRPNTPFKGEVKIEALIRKSGMVGMNTPGDMEGAFGRPVVIGTQDVNFAIDQVQK